MNKSVTLVLLVIICAGGGGATDKAEHARRADKQQPEEGKGSATAMPAMAGGAFVRPRPLYN